MSLRAILAITCKGEAVAVGCAVAPPKRGTRGIECDPAELVVMFPKLPLFSFMLESSSSVPAVDTATVPFTVALTVSGAP